MNLKKTYLLSLFLGFTLQGLLAQNLSDYVKIAKENNPGLQSSYKEFEASLLNIDRVKKFNDPIISFGYFISPIETRIGPQQAKISLSQKLPWFGTIKTNERMATVEADLLYEIFLEKEMAIEKEVKMKYFDLIELNQKNILLNELCEIIMALKIQIENRFENDNGKMSDIIRADIYALKFQNQLEINEEDLASTNRIFNYLLNRKENEIVNLNDFPIDFESVIFPSDSLLLSHPSIHQWELKKEGVELKEQYEELKAKPSFNLGMTYSVIGESTMIQNPDSGRDAIMPVLSFSIPLYTKANKASIQQTKILQESMSYKITEREINQYMVLEQNKYFIESLKLNNQFLTESIQKIQRLYELSVVEYENHYLGFDELIEVRIQLKLMEMEKLTVLKKLNSTMAELDYILSITTN